MNPASEATRRRIVREHMVSANKRQTLLRSLLHPAEKLIRTLKDENLGLTDRRKAEDQAKKMLRVAERLIGRMALSSETWESASGNPWPFNNEATAKQVLPALRDAYRKSLRIGRTPVSHNVSVPRP